MPSSSTRNTSEEVRLFCHFRECYARLCKLGLDEEAKGVVHIFSATLDADQECLYDWIQNDPNWLQEVNQHLAGREDSDLCCSAGIQLSDAATCLFEFGREREGGECCEGAMELYELAWQVARAEKRLQRGAG